MEEATGLLQITLEGDDVEPGKFPLRDLQNIGELTQHGVERMARVLLGEPGVAPGPLPEAVRRSTELLLVGIERGSAVAQIELRSLHGSELEAEPSLLPPSAEDLGIRALDSFVSGLHSLEAGTQPVVPNNWDMSVMEIAEKLGMVAAERNVTVTLRSQPPQGEARVARIRPDEAQRYRVNHTLVRRRKSARGELIAIDLEKGNLAVKSERGRVQCHFGESLLQQAKGLVGEVVVVSGLEEIDLASNRAGRLEVDSLEISTQQQLLGEDFWLNRSASEQAAEQGSRPLKSIADIAASDDFSDEDVATFTSAMDELRSQR